MDSVPVDDDIGEMLKQFDDISERTAKMQKNSYLSIRGSTYRGVSNAAKVQQLLMEDKKKDGGYNDNKDRDEKWAKSEDASAPVVDRSNWGPYDRQQEQERIDKEKMEGTEIEERKQARRKKIEADQKLFEELRRKRAEEIAEIERSVKEEATMKVLKILTDAQKEKMKKEIEYRKKIAQENKALADHQEYDKVREMIKLKKIPLKKTTCTIVREDVERSPEREVDKVEEQDPTAHGYCYECGINLRTEDDSKEHASSDKHQTKLRLIKILKDMEEATKAEEERRLKAEEEKKLREELERVNRESEMKEEKSAKLDALFAAGPSKPRTKAITQEPVNYEGIFDSCYMTGSPVCGGYSPAPDVPSSPEGENEETPAKKLKTEPEEENDQKLVLKAEPTTEAKDDVEEILKTFNEIPGRTTNMSRGEVSTTKCYNCGEVGHMSREGKKPVTCIKCGKEGHRSRDCSEKKQLQSRYVNQVKCYNCDKEGHLARECTDLKGSLRKPDIISEPETEDDVEIPKSLSEFVDRLQSEKLTIRTANKMVSVFLFVLRLGENKSI